MSLFFIELKESGDVRSLFMAADCVNIRECSSVSTPHHATRLTFADMDDTAAQELATALASNTVVKEIR